MKIAAGYKNIGTVFLIITIIAAVVASVKYFVWASSENMTDPVVAGTLILALILDIILIFKDNDYLKIMITALYSISVVKFLTDSVGSFVDAFQGINMFGNASHVNDIISISIVMGITVLLSVAVSFVRRINIP